MMRRALPLGQPIADREGVLIALRYGDKRWTTSAAELGLRYDLEATLAHAFEVGRGQGFLADSRQRLAMLTQNTPVEPVVSTDPVRVLDFMHRLAKDIDQPMQNASLRIENVQAVATPARTGYRLDTEASAALVAQALASDQPPDVPLVVTVQQPMVTDQSIAEAPRQRRSSSRRQSRSPSAGATGWWPMVWHRPGMLPRRGRLIARNWLRRLSSIRRRKATRFWCRRAWTVRSSCRTSAHRQGHQSQGSGRTL